MSGRDPVGFVDAASNFSDKDAEGPEFIRCMDGREPQVHDVWTFRDYGVTLEVHPTTQVDVSSGFVGEFANNDFT